MSNLYSNMAEVYDGMYQHFIDYDEEFEFYNALLIKYKCKSFVEIGCGSGNLAKRFSTYGENYCGLDNSNEMLNIAKAKNPNTRFIMGDMRNFHLQYKVNAGIITGRTISYLVSDEDVVAAFAAINLNLTEKGLLCFDCIDAKKFIPLITAGEKIIHQATIDNKNYYRESLWSVNDFQHGIFDWISHYYKEDEKSNRIKIGEDHSTLRAFFTDGVAALLRKAGFEVKEMIKKPSYAFDTFVMVAEKTVDL